MLDSWCSLLAMDMKKLRERVSKRPEEIAVALNVAVSTVWNWESGKHEPRLPLTGIPKFLETYQCTLDEAIAAAQSSRSKYLGE
jgi:putative transcriptional regulator